jgi:exonuclease I
LFLCLDTETSDLFDDRFTVTDPKQTKVHMVSLAATVFADDGQEVQSIYSIIKPDGWTVQPGAQAQHGITTEYATQHGVPVGVPLTVLMWMCQMVDHILVFNWNFDSRVIMRELHLNRDVGYWGFSETKGRCVMLAASAYLKLPNQHGYASYAWPKLGLAYEMICGKKLEGAHHALNDVRATAQIAMQLIRTKQWDITKDPVVDK